MRTFIKKAIALGALCATAVPAFADGRTTESSTLQFWAMPMTLIADGETVNYLRFFEQDDAATYSCFNLELTVPEGITINMKKQGRDTVADIELSARGTSTHSIICNMLDDNRTIRILGDSSVNADFYADDEDGNPLNYLFKIGLICSPDVAVGRYEIPMTQVKFVMGANADACVPNEELTATVMVTKDVETDIENLQLTEGEGVYYDLSGRKVDPSSTRGIIVTTSKKVVNK